MKNKTSENTSHLSVVRVAISDTGVRTNQLRNYELSLGDFFKDYFETPPVGTKDGPYFIRGPLEEDHDQRNDTNVECSSFIVLDGDKSVSPEDGSFVEGAPDPERAHEVLKQLGLPHILHTTNSHLQQGKGNKFRILIPTEPFSTSEVAAAAEYVCDLLASEGVNLANVPENARISQPWYFPRLTGDDSPYKIYFYGDPAPFKLPPDIGKNEPPVVNEKQPRDNEPFTEPRPRASDSIEAKFNENFGSYEQMHALLVRHGYKHCEDTLVNGSPARRYLCPASTSKKPGTMLIEGSDGIARIFSHHSSDPLNEQGTDGGGKDPFDVYRILKHGGDRSTAIRGALGETDPRPIIHQAPGETHRQVAEVSAKLAQKDPPVAFQRANSLVRIVTTPEPTIQDGVQIPKGTASIHRFSRNTLSLLLSANFRFGRFSKQEDRWLASDPYGPLIGGLLDGFGHWGEIPLLRGITEAPLMRQDGSILSNAGYDPTTGLYVDGRVSFDDLPENISRDDAIAAMEIVLSPFREFPFVDKDLGQACVLAYLLTLLLRPLLPTAPLFVISATTPGTGKGLLIEVANTVVRGSDAAIMPPVRGKESQEEMRKRITSVVAHGMSSLCLDNCTQPLGGDALNALLTASEWTDRQLGSNQVIKLPVCLTLSATGNNLGVRGDLVRRSILVQLDAKAERPELREFEVADLVGTTRERRAELLRALFIILKGYQQSGCTEFTKNRLGRFEEWSERVCHPIQWLGLPNPIDSQALLRQEDPEFEALSAILTAWSDLHKSAWKSTKDLIPDEYPKTPQQEALEQALYEVADNRDSIDAKRLGWYLKGKVGRVANGLVLERKDKGSLAGNHGHQYRVVPAGQSPAVSNPTQNDT